MSCQSYFILEEALVTNFGDYFQLKTVDEIRAYVESLDDNEPCSSLVSQLVNYLLGSPDKFMVAGGTIDINNLAFSYFGDSNPGDYVDMLVDSYVGVTLTEHGSYRINLGAGGTILSVVNNITTPGSLTMGDLASGITTIQISAIYGPGAPLGNVEFITAPINGYLKSVNSAGYIGCKISKCAPQPVLLGEQFNRVRLTNFEFHLNPLIYRKK